MAEKEDTRGAIWRSDGANYLICSWIMVILGVLTFLASFLDPAAGALRFVGSVFLSCWFPLRAIGAIVRAIYFLPGENWKFEMSNIRQPNWPKPPTGGIDLG